MRLVYRTPAWEDFVRLAVTEIRQFGGESIQIARRLRAMLEDLIQTLPGERTALLRQEPRVVASFRQGAVLSGAGKTRCRRESAIHKAWAAIAEGRHPEQGNEET